MTNSAESKAHILVVDDEPWITDLLKKDLGRKGFQVTSSNDPLDVVEMFSRDSIDFDILLTDDAMPVLTGVEMADQILQIKPDFPIFLVTGYTMLNPERILALGIKKLFTKPVDLKVLSDAIKEELEL